MYKYIENALGELEGKNIVVYGTGVFGKRCINTLKDEGILPIACSDSNSDKWGLVLCDINIISPTDISDLIDPFVIVAIENFFEPFAMLVNKGYKTGIFYNGKIYTPINVTIWNDMEPSDIERTLLQKEVRLVGDEKQIKDVQYIFNKFPMSIKSLKDLEDDDENSFLIICDKYGDNYEKALNELNYIQGIDYAYIEDFAPILDYKNRIYGRIPSLMFMETLFDSMKNQVKCIQPFNKMQLSSDFSVHCCCGDWADSWGNLRKNSMDEIWNSSIAKIFRLSIINRTYSFCKTERCVHMKINPKPTTDRIEPEYTATKIPEYIEVGIDKTCNLFCESCRMDVLIEKGEKKKQTEEVAENIIESGWLEKTRVLLLGGQGEVFVSPIYRSLMYDVENKRKMLDLRTNGTAFSEDDMRKLVDKYEHLRIIVSIDAATEKTYNALRRSRSKDTYIRLCENMKILADMRFKGEIDFLQINMCVQMKNYREIPAFIEYGESLGCDVINLTPIRNWGTYTKEEFKNIGVFITDKEVKPEVFEIIDKYKGKKNIQIAF